MCSVKNSVKGSPANLECTATGRIEFGVGVGEVGRMLGMCITHFEGKLGGQAD
jgi:hypothetical protein